MTKNLYFRNEALTVLLVEENLEQAELVKGVLLELRVPNRLVHVQNGQMAMDYLFQQGEYSEPAKSPRPHVVLLDISLSQMDGLEVLRTIKNTNQLQSIPVVILTTSQAEQDIACAYEYRANSYLVKPADMVEFKSMLETFGMYWLGWNLHPY